MSKKKSEAIGIEVEGRALKCLVCGHDAFWTRRALLNTAGLSFLNLDWANKSGTCQVCSRCGYIHWFLPKKK